jgi:hypothetical protein
MSPVLQIAELRRRIRDTVARQVAAHGFYPSSLYLGREECAVIKTDVGSGSGYEVRESGVFYLGLQFHETTDVSHIGVGQ